MNLRCLNQPRESIAISLSKWARKLKIPLTTKQTPIDAAIIIGDGTPDNIVWLILTHRLNGKCTVGLMKPSEFPRFASVEAIKTLIKGERVENVLLSVDQEASTLQQIWEEAEKSLRNAAIEFKASRVEGRFRVFDCIYTNHRFKTLIVVNGVDNPIYKKHTIEDHLLEFYKETLGEDLNTLLNESEEDPKEAWRRLKDKEEQIYQQLLTSDKTERIFTHHIAALRLLITQE